MGSASLTVSVAENHDSVSASSTAESGFGRVSRFLGMVAGQKDGFHRRTLLCLEASFSITSCLYFSLEALSVPLLSMDLQNLLPQN